MQMGEVVIKATDIATSAAEALDSKKGEDIAIYDVRGVSTVTDYYVVASGFSPPHLKAMFGGVQAELKKKDLRCYRRSGDPESGWMVLDYVDVIIHIFSAETRKYYQIEELWAEVPRQSHPLPTTRPQQSPQ